MMEVAYRNMKLRIRNNSVRLRLGQSEVLRLRDFGECRETVDFPGGSRLEYVLFASEFSEVAVSFADGLVSIAIPASQLRAWQSPDQVSLSAEVPVRPGETLQVLVEKDFRCLDDHVSEDQSDTFENPLAAHMSC
jgi:hypothetical protein